MMMSAASYGGHHHAVDIISCLLHHMDAHGCRLPRPPHLDADEAIHWSHGHVEGAMVNWSHGLDPSSP
jgi:hypothetical protein